MLSFDFTTPVWLLDIPTRFRSVVDLRLSEPHRYYEPTAANAVGFLFAPGIKEKQ
ncbi:hypothetical protein BH10PLA2_BH10PLA2_33550 [soil metagenome]